MGREIKTALLVLAIPFIALFLCVYYMFIFPIKDMEESYGQSGFCKRQNSEGG